MMHTPTHNLIHTLTQGVLLGVVQRVRAACAASMSCALLAGCIFAASFAVSTNQAHAEGLGQCVDVESIFGLSLNDRFRRVAQQLTSPTQRDALCAEIGLDCSDLAALTHPTTEEPKCASEPFDAPAETCTLTELVIDESSEDLLESIAEELFEKPLDHHPSLPVTSIACFDNPASCSALPPIDTSQLTFSTNPVPDTNDSLPFLQLHLTSLPVLAHLDGRGPAFANGVLFGIDRPPQRSPWV